MRVAAEILVREATKENELPLFHPIMLLVSVSAEAGFKSYLYAKGLSLKDLNEPGCVPKY